jgi:hypothetical protein
MAHQRLVMAFHGDGVNLSCLREGGRHAELDVPNKGFHRGESSVARGSAVAPLCLNVRQEVENQRRIDLFQTDL